MTKKPNLITIEFPSMSTIINEFHISKKAREMYECDASLFSFSGDMIFSDFPAVRNLTAKINKPDVQASHLNALGLIEEIFHYILHLYKNQKNPQALEQLLERLEKKPGKKTLDKALVQFGEEFPPISVFKGELSIKKYLKGETKGISNRIILLEELIMLRLSNLNEASAAFKKELIDDSDLISKSAYLEIIEHAELFFTSQPLFGPYHQNLISMLRTPAIVSPLSFQGQLQYIRDHWGSFLGDFLDRLLKSLDFIKEESKFGDGGPGKTHVLDFSNFSGDDHERFSRDDEWMPRLVLLAKSTYVWLDQLSKTYHRSITQLDQVPDEELDEMANRGFTGLWLIGVWERSRASQWIKQMCGNPEALASAYSIYDYRIANDLGGEAALLNLKKRAWLRGIRLASDMVPNHMSIDSPWVVEHPDWFISLNYSPYPSYTFNGPDLSSDSRVGIYLEDHYYDRTDAAVVFKWVNKQSGETRYIYHGNDGTSMPWNDTAQLNYLNKEVQEAVIRTMFLTGEKFPVIRFDAAMTLTKLHYQRLWFPEPGTGGDIPSRSEHGLSKPKFNEVMPEEFWRNVVDRFASSAHSNTLLLAEAFWLMEAYFVRNLGMHRVYNSAFMNFLKNEENAQFRSSIKNTLAFNREILKRFVNFMNNPDEETAVKQFGKEDKYFGCCTLLATMPGLPMFGHGQIEGFKEKYGMEYKRAYWDESPDNALIEKHEREIFPLLKKRYLFSDAIDFLLYDCITPYGEIDENVIAFSNSFENEHSLIIYHNRYGETSGWLKTSVPFLPITKNEKEKAGPNGLSHKTLGESLKLTQDESYFVIFQDEVSGLEYIRNSKELGEKGLFITLNAYKRHVFVNFREVKDESGAYAGLNGLLKGSGVRNIRSTLRKQFFNPFKKPIDELLNPHVFQELQSLMALKDGKDSQQISGLLNSLESKCGQLLSEMQKTIGGNGSLGDILKGFRRAMESFIYLPSLETDIHSHKIVPPSIHQAIYYSSGTWNDIKLYPLLRPSMYAWIIARTMKRIICPEGMRIEPGETWKFLEYWGLTDVMHEFIESNSHNGHTHLGVLKALLDHNEWWRNLEELPRWIDSYAGGEFVKAFVGVHWHNGDLWFKKESADEMIHILFFSALFEYISEINYQPGILSEILEKEVCRFFPMSKSLFIALRYSNYRWEKWLEHIKRIGKAYSPHGKSKNII